MAVDTNDATFSTGPLRIRVTPADDGFTRVSESGLPGGNAPYTITPGLDYNKWDEALFQHGAIHLPHTLDSPQQWLNHPHFKDFLNDIDREDLPDGGVILRLRKPVPMSQVAPQRFAQVANDGFTRLDVGASTGSVDGFTRLPATPVAPAPVQALQQPDMAGFTRVLDRMEQQPAAPQRHSMFDKMLEPITSYPSTQAHMAAEARDQVFKGAGQLFKGEPEGERLAGAGNMAVGALSYPLSPINAALRTVVGKPLEENTGIPKEYSEFATGLALPVVGFGKTPKTIQKIFSPETVSQEAMEAAALIRQRTGIAARDTESTAATLESWQKPVAQLPAADQLGIMHYIEGTGAAPATPSLRALADTLKDAFELRKTKLQALPEYAQRQFLEDYFPHFWTDPAAATNAVRSGAIKQGSGASLKQRTVPTMQEGIANGLTPLTTNPIEATLRYVTSMDKFIASQEILQTAKDAGTVIYRRPTIMGASGHTSSVQGIPPGYAPINGRGARSATGEQAYAPENWARIYNNFISPGIKDEWKGIYDMARRGSNAVTQTLLSLSGYHAFTMAEAEMSSQIARSIDAAVGGNVSSALKEAGKYAVAPVRVAATQPSKGAYLRDVYLGKQAPLAPQDRDIVDLITQAGGRMGGGGKHALDYESSALGDYLTSFRRGRLRMELAEQGKDIAQHPISGTARTVASNIGRVMDTMNKPLFQHYIPAMKNAAAYEDMALFLKNNPAATQAEKLSYARGVVDRIDNRFGEMIHDNIFWNKVAKQSAMLAMLSYSWNLGGWREIGGGIRDVARKTVAQGEWTPKASYVVGTALNWAIMSAAYQYMKTGEAPRDVHDLAAPRTGGIDSRSGEPERIIPPGIMKDVFGYWEHFGQEVINKVNPGVKLAGQSLSLLGNQGGSDWRGDPILSPRSPGQTALEKAPDWLAEYFRFVTKTMTPIQIQNISRGKEEGSNISDFEKALGIRKSSRSMVDPEGYETMLNRLWQRRWQGKQRHDKQEELRYGGTE